MQTDDAQTRDTRRVAIEAMLADYPEIPGHQLDELRLYFRKQASAHDVAMIASNDRIRRGYSLFRDDHVDRFTPGDWSKFVLALMGLVALIFGIGFLAS